MGNPIETVQIAWECDLGYLTINKTDFDPAIHSLYEVAPTEPLDKTPTQDERQAELEAMSWHKIKKLAGELDPAITETPGAGWDAVIPLILEAEYGTEN